METKIIKSDKFVMGLCMGCLVFLFFSIAISMFTRAVLVKHLKMKNAFTDFVFAEKEDLNNGDKIKEINWSELYSFSESNAKMTEKEERISNVGHYKAFVKNVEDALTNYSSIYLMGYKKETELAKKYDDLIGWNVVSFGEYNGVVKMSDGYLTSCVEQRDISDISEQADSLVSFKQFAHENGIEFVYVQAPHKVSEYDDKDMSGHIDFSNQNANILINKLSKQDVDVCDLREYIHKEGLRNHDLFYRTDHHWLTTTGLWGHREYCNIATKTIDSRQIYLCST